MTLCNPTSLAASQVFVKPQKNCNPDVKAQSSVLAGNQRVFHSFQSSTLTLNIATIQNVCTKRHKWRMGVNLLHHQRNTSSTKASFLYFTTSFFKNVYLQIWKTSSSDMLPLLLDYMVFQQSDCVGVWNITVTMYGGKQIKVEFSNILNNIHCSNASQISYIGKQQ